MSFRTSTSRSRPWSWLTGTGTTTEIDSFTRFLFCHVSGTGYRYLTYLLEAWGFYGDRSNIPKLDKNKALPYKHDSFKGQCQGLLKRPLSAYKTLS